MKKKKILVFIDWYAPGFKAGGPIRSCQNLVKQLGQEFEFFIVSSDTDYKEHLPYDNVKSNVWVNQKDGSKVYYISKDQMRASTFQQIIQNTEYDSVYLNGIFSWYFSILPLFYIKLKPIVLAARGMLFPGALSVKPLRKKMFLFLASIFSLHKNVIFQASSMEEKLFIQDVFPKNKIVLAGNIPSVRMNENFEQISKSIGSIKLISIARISPEKNTLFALQVLSKVKANVELNLFGPINDSLYWKECEKYISAMPMNIVVKHHGAIAPNLIPACLAEHHFHLLPSKGENFGHVLFESLQNERPIIVSDKTIFRNLEVKKAGWDLSLLDQNLFVRAIEKAASMSQEEYSEWSKGALSYSKEKINLEIVKEENRKLFL